MALNDTSSGLGFGNEPNLPQLQLQPPPQPYPYLPPGIHAYHCDRVRHVRALIQSGTSCILWDCDALEYISHQWRHLLNHTEQVILVPDNDLAATSDFLQRRYGFVVEHPDERWYTEPGTYPQTVYLEYPKLVENGTPQTITIHPQSYFGLDARETHRFGSLAPPLDPSYGGIMVPRYHTFLEGIIHYVINPPGPFPATSIFCLLNELLAERRGEEQQTLEELTTDMAKWYLGIFLTKNRHPVPSGFKKHLERRDALLRSQILKSGTASVAGNIGRRPYSTHLNSTRTQSLLSSPHIRVRFGRAASNALRLIKRL